MSLAANPSVGNAADRASPPYDSENIDVSSVDYVPACGLGRGFYVGTAGNVAILTPNNNTTTFTGVAAGTQIAAQFLKILHSGTTASNIVAHS